MSKIHTNLHIEGQLIYNNNPQEGYVLTTNSVGLVSWTSSTAVLPTASNTEFGYIKLGQSLSISTLGVAEVATASTTTIGGVIVGTGLTVSNSGVLSVSNLATTYTAGPGLTLSGSTFSIGTASTTTIGGVIVGTGLTISNTGLLSLSTTNLKTIYVSATGSDSNNGLSQFTPVLNLWKGRDLANSGDTVIVMPGSYIFDNRNAAGCPYNGLVDTKVNLWKDGVTYNFMPGAKIYSYGSTSISYSPYSDNMIFFQPNSLTFSVCTVTGELEFYATSEGADNSGGGHYLFLGEETNGSSTYPGYTFYMNVKMIDAGCTPLRAVRSSVGIGTASIYMNIQTLRYGYVTGQSANGAFCTWRGGDNSEMIVDMRIGEIICNSGIAWKPVFMVRPYSSSGINKLRVNIDIKYASILDYSYLLNYGIANSTLSYISSGQITFNCTNCIFSSSLFNLSQCYKNYYIIITGNYYCSGTFTGKYAFFPSTYPFICLWDQANDAISDNMVLDFKGNYYTNNPTRTIVHVGSTNTTSPPFYGYTNNIGNYTGDIYFAGTASNYTGTLFYVDMGKIRFSGRIHGTSNYSGYGFSGTVVQLGGSSDVFLTNAHIHSNLNSSLVSYGTPVNGQSKLTISNSFIDMTGTSSVIGDMRNLTTYIQNSTIRNRGTNDMFYNSLSTGTLQITNSTLINSSSTASTINYPLGTVIGAGAFSNKDIIISTLNGTVSVVSGLV